MTKCPCCNPVLSTWYCRTDCNSAPSTCIHILSYHWYSKAGHLVSSNDFVGISTANLVSHCWICDFDYRETWDTEGVWRRAINGDLLLYINDYVRTYWLQNSQTVLCGLLLHMHGVVVWSAELTHTHTHTHTQHTCSTKYFNLTCSENTFRRKCITFSVWGVVGQHACVFIAVYTVLTVHAMATLLFCGQSIW